MMWLFQVRKSPCNHSQIILRNIRPDFPWMAASLCRMSLLQKCQSSASRVHTSGEKACVAFRRCAQHIGLIHLRPFVELEKYFGLCHLLHHCPVCAFLEGLWSVESRLLFVLYFYFCNL